MKQLATALIVGLVTLTAGSASAAPVYPPVDPIVTPDNPTPAPGETVNLTVENCVPGETVEFTFEGETESEVCGADGTAVASFAAPATPGTYTGTASLVTSGVEVTFTITVQAAATTTTVAGELPRTGSSPVDTWVPMALLLVGVGVGLYAVARARRQSAAA